jgi:hypothetical protein
MVISEWTLLKGFPIVFGNDCTAYVITILERSEEYQCGEDIEVFEFLVAFDILMYVIIKMLDKINSFVDRGERYENSKITGHHNTR